MKILFLTDNFPPEVNAPATRTYEHCREWVKNGQDVTVITCFPNFPQGKIYHGYKNKIIQKEIIEGIKVIRVWTYITANEGIIKRSIDYFSFAISSTIAGIFVKTDIIIATSPQFFSAAAGEWLSLLKRKPWIMEVRDLWPESIKNVTALKSTLLFRFFVWWELRLYKTSKKIVVVTESFKSFIHRKGISNEKIFVVTNGANLELFSPRMKNQNLLKKLNLSHKFVISYIGTHGLAHKLDFILKCAANLIDSPYHFLIIGTGAERANLVKQKEALQLTNVTMLDQVEKVQVPEYLSISDISLINLKKSDLFKTVIPSKIFESSSMEIPILLGVDGESRGIIEKYGAGIFFEPENEQDFFRQLNRLYSDKELYHSCQQGCKALAKDYDRKALSDRMLSIVLDDHSKC